MKLFFARNGKSLVPTDEDSEKALLKIGQGEDVQVEIKRPRNIKWLRKYWLICAKIAENMPESTKRETVSDYIKLQSGHIRAIRVNGELREFPDSISFEGMTQAQWEEAWPRFEEIICRDLIPGLDNEKLELELFELLR